MLNTNFSRISLRQIRKLKISFFGVVIIFFGTSLFFYLRTIDSEQLIYNFSTSKTEWTSAEHGAFFSWLIAKYGFSNINLEQENTIGIKQILISIQKSIKEDLGKDPGTNKELNTDNLNLDSLDYGRVLELLTLDDKTLQDLPLTKLNLIDADKTPGYMIEPEGNEKSKLKYSILRNEKNSSVTPKSFVFIPTQLIQKDENKKIQLSIQLKRELIFSKFMEKYLREILREIDEANQAYFIPISGFVRICTKEREESDKKFDPVEQYKDKFRFKLDFADRLYFESTMREKFHTAPPYVDGGGGGIVRTYSISVISPKWGVVGMIGTDVQIKKTEDRILNKSWFDKILPQNPLIDICTLKNYEETIIKGQFKTKYKLLTTKDKNGIAKSFKETPHPNPKDITTRLNRFNFDEDGNVIIDKNKDKDKKKDIDDKGEPEKISRIIYTLPLAEGKLAIFIFDNKQNKRQDLVIVLNLGTILFISTLLILSYV